MKDRREEAEEREGRARKEEVGRVEREICIEEDGSRSIEGEEGWGVAKKAIPGGSWEGREREGRGGRKAKAQQKSRCKSALPSSSPLHSFSSTPILSLLGLVFSVSRLLCEEEKNNGLADPALLLEVSLSPFNSPSSTTTLLLLFTSFLEDLKTTPTLQGLVGSAP